MIVYKEVKPTVEWPKIKICIKCKSELGVEKEDVIQISKFDQREGNYNVSGFKCPVCYNKQELYK